MGSFRISPANDRGKSRTANPVHCRRRPNTDNLGLDAAGVEVDKGGFIHTDDELRTNVPGIWALGDCNGRGAFTHTSYNDFEIVAATFSTAIRDG